MTVAARPATITYREDGASVRFPIPYRFKAASDLIVERLLTGGGVQRLVSGTDYTATGGTTDAGGELVRTIASAGAELRIRRATARAQPMTYATGDRFPAASHEEALDRQMLIAQEADATTANVSQRALMVPDGEVLPDLPALAERLGGAKKILAINQDTGAIAIEPISDTYRGNAGPSNNSRATLTDLKAAKTSDLTSLYAGSLFTWTPGNFAGQADDYRIIASDNAALTVGAWVRSDGPLYAGNFGVRDDDGVGTASQIDQRAAAQAFIDLCASQQRAANFGGLRVGISGTVRSHSTPIVFDNLGNRSPQPGFYPRDTGTRYWAVIMTGAAPGTKIAVRSRGTYVSDGNGGKLSDTRPGVNGILFGAEKAGDSQFFLSTVDNVYVNDLRGIGVRREIVHDCTFQNIMIERCGEVEGDTIFPAFADTADFGTVNETVTSRLQVELAYGQAILVHPNTLSCAYSKIHSEGLAAVDGVPGWVLGGGQNIFDAPRLDATGKRGVVHVSGAVQIRGPRFEKVDVYVSGAGETLNVDGGGGRFRPLPGATGRMNFFGVTGDWIGLTPGFNLDGCTIGLLEIGANTDPAAVKVSQSSVATLRPIAGETSAAASFSSCTIASWTPLAINVFTNGTTIGMTTATIGYCTVRLYDSTLWGNVSLDTAFLDAKGAWKIDGNLVFTANAQSLFDDGGYVTGSVAGFSYPVAAQYLRHYRGMYCANIACAPGQPTGWKCVTTPSAGTPGTWKEVAGIAA